MKINISVIKNGSSSIYKIILIIVFSLMFHLYYFRFRTLKNIVFEIYPKKRIYTFWEPQNQIPGYLKLCIETWKKFLPEYEIKILDYQSAKEYIGEDIFSKIICKNMTLPIQADAIRVALMKKYGGIWMDTDIIILDGKFIKELEKYELSMVGDEKYKIQSIGFIFACKNSYLINKWLNEIIEKVENYKKIMQINNNSKNFEIIKKKVNVWNYLGNSIIDNLLKNASRKMFFRIDRNKIKALPEINFFKNSTLNYIQKYRQFYFQKRDYNIINESKSLLYLHNSWTPLKYKKMTEKDFLKQDILLSNLLRNILNKNI